jgi:hypothetical protein
MGLCTPFFVHGAKGSDEFYLVWNDVGGAAGEFIFPKVSTVGTAGSA